MFAAYNFGVCLEDVHRYKEAIEVLEPLVALRYRVLGPTHNDTLFAAWRLAECSALAGDKPAVLAVLEQVHSNLKAIETTRNLRCTDPLQDIIALYVELQRYDRAAEVQDSVYRMFAEALRKGDVQGINVADLLSTVTD